MSLPATFARLSETLNRPLCRDEATPAGSKRLRVLSRAVLLVAAPAAVFCVGFLLNPGSFSAVAAYAASSLEVATSTPDAAAVFAASNGYTHGTPDGTGDVWGLRVVDVNYSPALTPDSVAPEHGQLVGVVLSGEEANLDLEPSAFRSLFHLYVVTDDGATYSEAVVPRDVRSADDPILYAGSRFANSTALFYIPADTRITALVVDPTYPDAVLLPNVVLPVDSPVDVAAASEAPSSAPTKERQPL